MNTTSKKIRLYNPCIVKIYKGVHITNNNYIKYQEMNAKELQKVLKMQNNTNTHSLYSS
jgi:hypothetical protein